MRMMHSPTTRAVSMARPIAMVKIAVKTVMRLRNAPALPRGRTARARFHNT